MPEVVIQLNNITKIYKSFSLSNITLNLERGELLMIVGSNGAGKSTLIDIIAGVVNHDNGSLELFGKEFKKLSGTDRCKIGVIRGESVFPEDLKVGIFLKSAALLYNNWDYPKMDDLLIKYNIDKKKKIKDLSTGMKMKLWFVIALSHAAEILLLDEPFAGMDINSKNDFIECINQLKVNRSTIVFATHEYDNIENLCDKLLFLADGKIHYYGEFRNFLSNWTKIEFYGQMPPQFNFSGMIKIKENDKTIWFINKKINKVKENISISPGENILISEMTLREIVSIFF